MWRVVVLAAAGCAVSHGARIVEMSVGCLGRCEQYSVAVYGDGFVEYRGYTRVLPGRRTAQLDRAKLAQLDALFADFATLAASEMQCEATDLGELYVIEYRGQRIEFFSLCNRVPLAALELAGGVRATLALDRWFGTDKERAHLRQAR